MRSGIKEPATAPIHVLEIIGNAIVGGMENYVFNLAGHLPEHGFKLTCLAPYESAYTASLRSLGCEVYVTPMHVDVPWRSIQFTTELIRQKHIDLVHATWPMARASWGWSNSQRTASANPVQS
ncbi:MAG TPA: glycosyltransferase family 4 protein, partial [Anaerolineaceae bacterium]|nr:glycosyltransferase family 4 protein [Anaerolineaceae bacterium]